MILKNAADQFKYIRHSNAVAAGTSVITPSAGIDMAGFKGIVFIVEFGAITATAVTSVELFTSTDNSSFTTTGVTKSVADDQDNKIVIVEAFDVTARYIKCVVNRGTANAVLEGITAFLHGGRTSSPAQDASVSATYAGSAALATLDTQ